MNGGNGWLKHQAACRLASLTSLGSHSWHLWPQALWSPSLSQPAMRAFRAGAAARLPRACRGFAEKAAAAAPKASAASVTWSSHFSNTVLLSLLQFPKFEIFELGLPGVDSQVCVRINLMLGGCYSNTLQCSTYLEDSQRIVVQGAQLEIAATAGWQSLPGDRCSGGRAV
jgi:hypothetical protein